MKIYIFNIRRDLVAGKCIIDIINAVYPRKERYGSSIVKGRLIWTCATNNRISPSSQLHSARNACPR